MRSDLVFLRSSCVKSRINYRRSNLRFGPFNERGRRMYISMACNICGGSRWRSEVIGLSQDLGEKGGVDVTAADDGDSGRVGGQLRRVEEQSRDGYGSAGFGDETGGGDN